MSEEKKVRVAIIGVGNCASSLVQGVQFYRDAADGVFIPGLMHANLGGYHIGDIEFTAAFDVVDQLRARAGNMPLSVRAEFGPFVEKLDRHELPGGILYEVQNVPDVASANRCMEKVRAYRVYRV